MAIYSFSTPLPFLLLLLTSEVSHGRQALSCGTVVSCWEPTAVSKNSHSPPLLDLLGEERWFFCFSGMIEAKRRGAMWFKGKNRGEWKARLLPHRLRAQSDWRACVHCVVLGGFGRVNHYAIDVEIPFGWRNTSWSLAYYMQHCLYCVGVCECVSGNTSFLILWIIALEDNPKS